MKIIFTGGGTLGPVTPLLAVYETWKQKNQDLTAVWVGTSRGPERRLVAAAVLPFYSLPVARLPRYLSWEWLTFPVFFVAAFLKALWILRREQPDLIASAGGFTGVPMIYAGWLLGIRAWVHQLDIQPLLSNRLTAPLAKYLTVTWPNNLNSFKKPATIVGALVRPSLLVSVKNNANVFSLDQALPTVFILGGGSGSTWLNEIMLQIGPRLIEHANVIHVTGRGKMMAGLKMIGPRYHVAEFLDEEMAAAWFAATVVVSRAGMGALSELAAFEKPAVIIPLPDSPQEMNAAVLAAARAAIVLTQKDTPASALEKTILSLLTDTEKRRQLSERISTVLSTDGAKQVVELLNR